MATRMKGLNQFIADIRNCKNKEDESKRVEKEMAKIRTKFTKDQALDGYQKKKYVWKLLYMMTLGYDVDFGHHEATTLIAAAKFSEKYTGYVATSVMVTERTPEIYQRIAQSIKSDLISHNEVNQCLAISSIGTTAPKDLVEVMIGDIEKMALKKSSSASMFVRKKSILCLLRIFRKFKDKFNIGDHWGKSAHQMLEEKNLGFLTSVVSFISGVVTLTSPDTFSDCVHRLIKILYRVVIQKECGSDYLYYHTPSPWLQVKIFKCLQLFPPPSESKDIAALNDILHKILTKTEVTKSVNKNNADHGILFEAINMIIHCKGLLNKDLQKQALSLLGVFISVKEPNIRYLALESLAKFHDTSAAEGLIKEHLKTILAGLNERDVSIRRRALDILYIMCTPATADKIVNKLLNQTEEHDVQIKEELTLRIAILAEKFADNLIWYIDVVVRLVSSAGDYITDEIWHRIIQIITGFGSEPNIPIQQYAANKLFSALSLPNVHENLVKIGAYVFAEYSKYITDQPGKDPEKILDILNRHWTTSTSDCKAMILNAYVKLANQYPDLKFQIQTIFEVNSQHWDPDIQQRAVEYLALIKEDPNNGQMDQIRQHTLSQMPTYSEDIQANNILLKKIYSLKKVKSTKESKDPTLKFQQQKEDESNMMKTQSVVTSNKAASEFKTIGKETVNLGIDGEDLLNADTNPASQSGPSGGMSSGVGGGVDLLGGGDDLLSSGVNVGGPSGGGSNDLLGGGNDLLGGGSVGGGSGKHHLESHPLFYTCEGKIATKGNIVDKPARLPNTPNADEVKALLTKESGTILENNQVSINYKTQFEDSIGKIAMQFVSKSGKITDLDLQIQDTMSLMYKVAPTNYGGDHPSCMIQCLNTAPGGPITKAKVSFNQGGSNQDIVFALPILANKFVEPVNMPAQKFDELFDQFTNQTNDAYFRLDDFIKNPNTNADLPQIMSKIGSLLENGLNLQVMYQPNQGQATIVNGVGQYVMKPEGQDITKRPVMLQFECFESNKEWIRFSLRGGANKEALISLHQVVVHIVNPQ